MALQADDRRVQSGNLNHAIKSRYGLSVRCGSAPLCVT